MNFTAADRVECIKLIEASEEKLGTSRITDWLSPAIFRVHFLAHVADDICVSAVA